MPNVSPNMSQNIVHVGYVRVGFALGMYISCCLCQFHSCWLANTTTFFMWNMGLTLDEKRDLQKCQNNVLRIYTCIKINLNLSVCLYKYTSQGID